MRCVNPLLIKSNTHGYLERNHVPCGTCGFCLQNKRNQWSFRIQQELKRSSSANFISLTYDEQNIPISKYGEEELSKKDFQNFLKRLRKQNLKMAAKYIKYKTVKELQQKIDSLRYYAVGEYGTKSHRPHYHAIMFNMQPKLEDKLEATWKKGIVHSGKVTPASIHYVTKYVVTRNAKEEDKQKEFALISKGLGDNYTHNTKEWHQINGNYWVRDVNGQRMGLPKYYKDKMFTRLENKQHQKKTIRLTDEQELEQKRKIELIEPNYEKYILESTNNILKKITKNVTKNELL